MFICCVRSWHSSVSAIVSEVQSLMLTSPGMHILNLEFGNKMDICVIVILTSLRILCHEHIFVEKVPAH